MACYKLKYGQFQLLFYFLLLLKLRNHFRLRRWLLVYYGSQAGWANPFVNAPGPDGPSTF
uniref:Interferon-related developmental regulator 1-like n=1 Tax=Rhizophora mucronata TaxID=61149 RepID=A0A2P2J4W3_RHIMU